MKIVLTILFFPIYFSSLFCQNQPLKITKLLDNFFVYTTSKNFKGILFPSNGMYVVTTEGVILIDTPWDTTQCQPLLDSIYKRHQLNVKVCVVTHSHDDRTGGLAYLNSTGIKTYSSFKTKQLCQSNHENMTSDFYLNDTTFNLGGIKFETRFYGEGHTSDNIIIWFDQQKVLYGGCLIKSTDANDLGNLKDANIVEWSSTLAKIKSRFKNLKFIIPGHQSWTSNKSIEHTLKLLKEYKP